MRARAAAAVGGGAYEAEGSEGENETPVFGKSDCRKYKYIACGTLRGCIWVGNVGCGGRTIDSVPGAWSSGGALRM